MAEIMLDLDKAQKRQKEFMLFGWKEPAFLEDGKSNITTEINSNLNTIRAALNQTSQLNVVESVDLSFDVEKLSSLVNSYQQNFNDLTALLHKRGFKDHGLEGEMRTYAHQLQERISPEEQVFALTLRKHEKDFALRHDTKYVDRLHNTVSEFVAFIKNADIQEFPHMTSNYKEKAIDEINAYKNHFDRIVLAEMEIGLTQENGMLLELEEILKQTTPKINFIYAKINDKNNALKKQAQITIGLTILFLIMGSLFLIYLLRKTVSKPIIKLDNIVKKVLSGDREADKYLDVDSKDEIGSLSRNFQQMLENLRSNLKLINEKNETLEAKAKLDERRNWSTEGLAKFAQLMKNDESDQATFAYTIISELVKYIGASQGALFVVESENDFDSKQDYLSLKGCYAFERKKYLNKKIARGEGLIGQSWLEGDHIYLTDVPDNYLNIRSGLGDASPRSILIVPVKHKETITGVIELASFKEFSEASIEFIKEFASRLGANLSAIKMQEKTTLLLQDSQEMTEELKAQEEEMRQNMEELQATQEEMTRNQQNIEAQLEGVKLEKKLFNRLIAKVYDGVLVIDEHYKIVAISQYLQDELYFNKEDLIGNTPEQVFKCSLDKRISELDSDPQFILTGISERKECAIMDKYGAIDQAKFVMTKIKANGCFYSFILFNKVSQEYDKKALRRLFAPEEFN
jgi:methyl-accepting chemotaxis protein